MLQYPSGTDFRDSPPTPDVQVDLNHPLDRAFSIAGITMTIGWYRIAVLALWLLAVTWLAVCKILPLFFMGEPPVYESAVDDKPRPPVAWYVYLNDRRLGWAWSELSQQSNDTGASQQSGDTSEIQSVVHLDKLPIEELLPIGLRAIAYASTQAAGSTEWEVESTLITNPLNQLVSFSSKLRPKNGQSLAQDRRQRRGRQAEAYGPRGRCGMGHRIAHAR